MWACGAGCHQAISTELRMVRKSLERWKLPPRWESTGSFTVCHHLSFINVRRSVSPVCRTHFHPPTVAGSYMLTCFTGSQGSSTCLTHCVVFIWICSAGFLVFSSQRFTVHVSHGLLIAVVWELLKFIEEGRRRMVVVVTQPASGKN